MFRNNINKKKDKNITKVVRSLENRGVSLKGTTEKNENNQEDGFLGSSSNSAGPLMKFGLPLAKMLYYYLE